MSRLPKPAADSDTAERQLEDARRRVARLREEGRSPKVIARYESEVRRLQDWVAAGGEVPYGSGAEPSDIEKLLAWRDASVLVGEVEDPEGPARVSFPEWETLMRRDSRGHGRKGGKRKGSLKEGALTDAAIRAEVASLIEQGETRTNACRRIGKRARLSLSTILRRTRIDS